MNDADAVLQPCPFCGGEAEVITRTTALRGSVFQVRCTIQECGVVTMWWYPKSAAVQAWNRRAS